MKKDADARRLFPPSYETNQQAQEALLEIVHRSPQEVGQGQSRWTLKALLESCSWLNLKSESGLWRLLQRLGIVRKQGRIALHSPDENYEAKMVYMKTCMSEAQVDPDHIVFLYLDEFSYYRQPTVARAYEQRGDYQWHADLSHHSNSRCRGLGALNALTGQVHYCQAEKITPKVQIAFYHSLLQAYPDAKTLYVAQDNWPNHAHPKILAGLEAQRTPFFPNTFSNWSTGERYTTPPDALPIQLVFLPTYAPWTNPIEKLWRYLRQTVLHLHRFSDQWAELKQRVLDFMAQFDEGSMPLLHYVGLLPD